MKSMNQTAVIYCKIGRSLIKINGVGMRIKVSGGGHSSQNYAIRQSNVEVLATCFQKFVDEQSKKEIKDSLISNGRSLLVTDPRRCESKKLASQRSLADSGFHQWLFHAH